MWGHGVACDGAVAAWTLLGASACPQNCVVGMAHFLYVPEVVVISAECVCTGV